MFPNVGQLDTGQFDTGQLDTGQLSTGQLDTGQLNTGLGKWQSRRIRHLHIMSHILV